MDLCHPERHLSASEYWWEMLGPVLFSILTNNLDKDTDGTLIKFWNDVKQRVIANMLDVRVKI